MRKINSRKRKPIKESTVRGNYYGLPDVKYVWNGEWADPGLIYQGKYFNVNDIEDALWDDFREYCEETGVVEDYDMFDQWMNENTDMIYFYLDELINTGAGEDMAIVPSAGPFRGGWRKNGQYIDGESLNRKFVRENSMKLKIREVSHSELSPSYDSRKSFYGKAHVVTDDDGTEILYSYDTPVVKIKDGKVELLAQWDSSQTTLRHVKEFLQQHGFKVGSKAQIAKMYGRAVESVRKFRG